MFRDSLIAIIRTAIAALVGAGITWMINMGIDIPDGFEVQINAVLLGLATAGYNALVIWLQTHVHPGFGYMLGIPKAPAYGDAKMSKPEYAPLIARH